MKLYLVTFAAALLLSTKGEARLHMKSPDQRKLGDSEIDVTFTGVRPERVPGWDPGDEEEWDLEFKVEAFKLDMNNMSFESIAKEDDSFTLEVPEDEMGDHISIDGEVELTFDESEWENEDLRLYKITVSGTELDESIDESSEDDELPSCSRVFNHQGGRFRDSVTCTNDHHEFKVYFKVRES